MANDYYQDKDFDFISGSSPIRFTDSKKELIVIRDCNFLEIKYQSYGNYITIGQSKTFYITDCTFYKCSSKKCFFYIKSRATTFSHICSSKFTTCDQNSETSSQPSYLNSDIPKDSFFKFIYSTITGRNDEILSSSIFRISGKSALRVQCINISRFHTKIENERSIFHVTSPLCFSMQMNTFTNIMSKNLFIFCVKNSNPWYVNMLNLHENWYNETVIELQMDSGTSIYFNDCVFSKQTPYPYSDSNPVFFKKNDGNLFLNDCVFEKNLNSLQNCFTENVHVVNNPTTLAIPHYVVEGTCNGIKVENATGCNNDNCPDEIGCDKNNFKFKDDDVSYSQKHHVDIDGPTPSPSIEFTKSLEFSYSKDFTKSNYFSESNEFTKTIDFTKTNIFSNTEFSISINFSNSNLLDKFSFSEIFVYKSNIDIFINSDSSSSFGKGMKIGIGVLVGIVAIALVLATFLIIFKRKKAAAIEKSVQETDIHYEAFDIQENTENILIISNPLNKYMKKDDPFEDEFE